MRDAIILSGWTWEARNVPERLALALNYLGARVLYCEIPVSIFRRMPARLQEVQKDIFRFRPSFFGQRLNRVPVLAQLQAKLLAWQILRNAESIGLKCPLLVYPHGDDCLGIAKEFKSRNLSLVHVCMDYHLKEQLEHVRLSDLTLTIPEAAYKELRADFGDKIHRLPQLANKAHPAREVIARNSEPAELSTIPHPRLLYLGGIEGRVDVDLLGKLLTAHPEWHFISFGVERSLGPPNAHVLSWRSSHELEAVLDHCDLGFLPYDCRDLKNLHCVPLKLFDYFSRGIPVVGTPIVYVQGRDGLVYTGATAEELAECISRALREPKDSPLRQLRLKDAAEHSIEKVAQHLAPLLEVGSSRTLELEKARDATQVDSKQDFGGTS